VRVVLLFVCVRLSCHLAGGLNPRACWARVGLGRLSGLVPDL
jgi:hypothetical protein